MTVSFHTLYQVTTAKREYLKVKVKVSRYTPWRRMGGEEV
jgi:hypothetical protein